MKGQQGFFALSDLIPSVLFNEEEENPCRDCIGIKWSALVCTNLYPMDMLGLTHLQSQRPLLQRPR